MSSIELIDDSHKHAGHAGAKGGGGHFELVIVSPLFSGKSTQAPRLAAKHYNWQPLARS